MPELESGTDHSNNIRRNRFLIGFLILYFIGLMTYATIISHRRMPFFTRIAGHASYEPGSALALRFFVIGTQEMAPLDGFQVKLAIIKPGSKESWPVWEGDSGARAYLDCRAALPDLPAGDYLGRAAISRPPYGSETNEFPLRLARPLPRREIDVQKLDPKFTKQTAPIRFQNAEVRIIANQGRFVPNLNNRLLIAAEDSATRLPVSGLKIKLTSGGKTWGEAETDEAGYSRIEFYPHSLGDERVKVELADKEGRTLATETTLSPPGSQVLMTPRQFFWPQGTPLHFKLETIKPGTWHIDVFRGGSWLSSTTQEMRGAPVQVDLPLPKEIQGLVHVQVANDFIFPQTSFDAFYAFVYDPKSALADENDPRVKEAASKGAALADLELETPSRQIIQQIEETSLFSSHQTMNWSQKLKNMYQPRHLVLAAEQVLREIPKDYILLPQILNTRDGNLKAFADKQKKDAASVIGLLGLSGVIIALLLIRRIFKELKDIRNMPAVGEAGEEGVEGRISLNYKRVLELIAVLAVIIIGYGMILYFLANMTWYMNI